MDSLCEQETMTMWGSRRSPRQAFEAIVKQHMKDAYFIALGLVGNREDALELSQEAFYRAYKHFDQLNSQEKFFPWFYQILRNLCFSHLRRRKVRRAYEQGPDDSLGAAGDCAPNASPAVQDSLALERDDAFDPEMVAERNESKDRVWRAISQLDEKHREVIILRHFRNLSYDEMAKALFCNRGTVTSRLYYARQRLKEILDRESGSRDPKPDTSEPRKGGQMV
ncbi:MAG: sigma-70 family RNA polymerase sigma factor [Sedimentisphaerales bacterium]|nr:sigma-70 family RNA polymerase sigma factor [Sedimentisphaerales bacterium]